MSVFEELDNIIRTGYNSEKLQAIKPKLDDYLTTCPEEYKARCQREIELVERLIKECKEVDELRQQYSLFHEYVLNKSLSGFVELEYTEPNGNSYGVEVKVGNYIMELVYKPMDEPEKNEIIAKFYINVNGMYKAFMIKKDVIPDDYDFLHCKRKGYYSTSVRWNNWGDIIINTIEIVKRNPQAFLQMCQHSCSISKE